MLNLFAHRLLEILNRICLMLGPSNCRLSLFWEALLWPQLAFLAFRLSVLCLYLESRIFVCQKCTSFHSLDEKDMHNAFIRALQRVNVLFSCFYLLMNAKCTVFVWVKKRIRIKWETRRQGQWVRVLNSFVCNFICSSVFVDKRFK